jgi:hypothetical protein
VFWASGGLLDGGEGHLLKSILVSSCLQAFGGCRFSRVITLFQDFKSEIWLEKEKHIGVESKLLSFRGQDVAESCSWRKFENRANEKEGGKSGCSNRYSC